MIFGWKVKVRVLPELAVISGLRKGKFFLPEAAATFGWSSPLDTQALQAGT